MPSPYRLPPSVAGLASALWHPASNPSQGDGSLPPSPPPPQTFQPEPFVNNPYGQSVLHEALRTVPAIGSHLTGRIQVGPDQESTDALSESGLRPDEYGESTLLGTHNRRTHDISISPATATSNDEIAGTLMHELTHAAGYGEDEAYQVGNATRSADRSGRLASNGLALARR